MKDWQFNVLFAVAVLGTLFLLVAPAIEALNTIPKNPTAVGGIGLILTYVLQEKRKASKKKSEEDEDATSDK